MQHKKTLEELIQVENETVESIVWQWNNHFKIFMKEIEDSDISETVKMNLSLDAISDIFISILISFTESTFQIKPTIDKREAMHAILDCMFDSLKYKFEKFLKNPEKFRVTK